MLGKGVWRSSQGITGPARLLAANLLAAVVVELVHHCRPGDGLVGRVAVVESQLETVFLEELVEHLASQCAYRGELIALCVMLEEDGGQRLGCRARDDAAAG